MGYTKWVTLDFFDYVEIYFFCYSGQFFLSFYIVGVISIAKVG